MKTIKKVVNGLLYNTENAKKIGEYAEVDRSDFLECILFLAPNGHYFLAKRSGCFNEDAPIWLSLSIPRSLRSQRKRLICGLRNTASKPWLSLKRMGSMQASRSPSC